jgi:hypothetical protein
MALADQGEPFHQILRHYYTGIRLQQLAQAQWGKQGAPVQPSTHTVQDLR